MELFSQLEWLNVSALLRAALLEDLGQGDLTTAATVTPGQRGRAHIVVKESTRIVFCGGVLLAEVFRLAGAYPEIAACAYEGNVLERGDNAAVIEGRLTGLLIGERTALNLVQLMSGIATMSVPLRFFPQSSRGTDRLGNPRAFRRPGRPSCQAGRCVGRC